jgi:hypothetical protein
VQHHLQPVREAAGGGPVLARQHVAVHERGAPALEVRERPEHHERAEHDGEARDQRAERERERDPRDPGDEAYDPDDQAEHQIRRVTGGARQGW